MVRAAVAAFVAIVVWFLSSAWDGRPDPVGLDASPAQFSAARADAVLGRILGEQKPHPVSSDEATAVRGRVQQELSAVGVATTVVDGTGCFVRDALAIASCASTQNLVGEVVPGAGPAIVLMAHYDSVPAGPGAGDDASGVASIIEAVRALKAGKLDSKHPILVLITDGEEAGLLGAEAMLSKAEFRARVGVVVNMEARGNTGPSLLFQTSPGDSPMIDLYKDSVDRYATSSLFALIYEVLPNDTDLTPFLDAKLPGFNFAFSGNLPHYHTPLDRRENLDRSTLQHHGDNLLGLIRTLQHASLDSLKGGGNDVYVPIFGRWLPRLPGGLALPFALVALVVVIVALVLSRRSSTGGGIVQWIAAIAIVPIVLIGSIIAGFVVHTLAALVSGQPDPSAAHPALLRLALGAGVFAVFIACTRLADPRRAALAIWLWTSVLGVLTAATLPGISPYFLFPALVAAIALVAQVRRPDAWTGRMGRIALGVAAAPAVVLWLGLAAIGESVQGLALHPLFTLPLAFALLPLLPIVGDIGLPRRRFLAVVGGLVLLALLLAVAQGLRPAYSASTPQRLSIDFVDDHVANEAYWVAETGRPLPASVRKAAAFSETAKPRAPLFPLSVFTAPAGAPRLPAPTATVTQLPGAGGRTVTLALQTAADTGQVRLGIPRAAGLCAFSVNGTRQALTKAADEDFVLFCMSRDCQHATIALEVGAAPFDVSLASITFGLPADGQVIAGARPAEAVPSQNGDTTIVLSAVHVGGPM
jgi:hypothetical protein